jgi:hypothetical protein
MTYTVVPTLNSTGKQRFEVRFLVPGGGNRLLRTATGRPRRFATAWLAEEGAKTELASMRGKW